MCFEHTFILMESRDQKMPTDNKLSFSITIYIPFLRNFHHLSPVIDRLSFFLLYFFLSCMCTVHEFATHRFYNVRRRKKNEMKTERKRSKRLCKTVGTQNMLKRIGTFDILAYTSFSAWQRHISHRRSKKNTERKKGRQCWKSLWNGNVLSCVVNK